MSASKQVYYDYQIQQGNGYADCQWQEVYEVEQLAAEYRRWQMQEAEAMAAEAQQGANATPVVTMYTDTLPAQPTALGPLVAELAHSQDAIAATFSELNMLVLNTADAAFRSQIKKIATGLVNKAPLMAATKENYLQMLEAAEVSAACYYGRPVVADTTTGTVGTTPAGVNPYKRRYDSPSEIARHLATASSIKEVASLYYVNAELVERTPMLKQAFSDRRAKLRMPVMAAA